MDSHISFEITSNLEVTISKVEHFDDTEAKYVSVTQLNPYETLERTKVETLEDLITALEEIKEKYL